MNTAANAISSFTVDYEELIYREQSLYHKTITINPGDIVDNLSASIRVKDLAVTPHLDVVSSEEIVCQYSASAGAQRAAGSDEVSLICVVNMMLYIQWMGLETLQLMEDILLSSSRQLSPIH